MQLHASRSLCSRRFLGGGLVDGEIRAGNLHAGGEKGFSRPPFSPPTRNSLALIFLSASPPPKNLSATQAINRQVYVCLPKADRIRTVKYQVHFYNIKSVLQIGRLL
jgi:hypothetical protein